MRILVIDPEYLVALDGQQVLSDALGHEVEIAMPRDYPTILENRHFDIVLIDVRIVQEDVDGARRRIEASGAKAVLSSLSHVNADGFAGWPDAPVVLKPFDDQRLIQTIRNAAVQDHGVSPPRT